MLTTILIYLATGITAGLMAGLFGVGGGMIMVPALALVLPAQGVAPVITMQVAVATSLTVISATSISSMLAHHSRGGVLWPIFRRMSLGLAAGAVVGAFVADLLPSRLLAQIVGVGALLTAIQMFLDLKPRPAAHAQQPLPGRLALSAAGSVIGVLSSLIGIGGGSLTVPFLGWCGVTIRQAVGTAAACGVPIAWAGAIGFMIAGQGEPGRPAWSVGYVDLAGFAGIAVASVLAAPYGARLAHRLSPRTLKRCFAVLLILIAFHMLRGSISRFVAIIRMADPPARKTV